MLLEKRAGNKLCLLTSAVWNSSAVSSATWCRPALGWFCPLCGSWAALASSLASLACYNRAGMPGMWDAFFPVPPNYPISNVLSTFWVSFNKHSSPRLTLTLLHHSISLTHLLSPSCGSPSPTPVLLTASRPGYRRALWNLWYQSQEDNALIFPIIHCTFCISSLQIYYERLIFVRNSEHSSCSCEDSADSWRLRVYQRGFSNVLWVTDTQGKEL